jgi:hypothetical protein
MKEERASSKRKKLPRISVWFTEEEEREEVKRAASAHGKTASGYLRALGLGYPVRSTLDQKAILELVKIAGDQGRLGGLLKLWLTNPEKVFDYRRVKDLLTQIEALQKTLANEVDKYTKGSPNKGEGNHEG